MHFLNILTYKMYPKQTAATAKMYNQCPLKNLDSSNEVIKISFTQKEKNYYGCYGLLYCAVSYYILH